MSIGISRIEKKTIAWIRRINRKFKPAGEIFEVAISGGKDSVVLYDLMVRSGVEFKAFYNWSEIEPPESLPFIKKYYPETIIVQREKTFWELLLEKGYPSYRRRWCVYELKSKRHPLMDGRYRVMGLRAEESRNRARFKQISKTKGYRRWIIKPIFFWKEWQVWEYINKYNLPIHPGYEKGLDRIGCIVCPLVCRPDKKYNDFRKKLYPKQYAMFEKTMTKLYYIKIEWAKGKYNKEDLVQTPAEFIDNWYRGSQIPYVKRDWK